MMTVHLAPRETQHHPVGVTEHRPPIEPPWVDVSNEWLGGRCRELGSIDLLFPRHAPDQSPARIKILASHPFARLPTTEPSSIRIAR